MSERRPYPHCGIRKDWCGALNNKDFAERTGNIDEWIIKCRVCLVGLAKMRAVTFADARSEKHG